jgi:hypothetical protein
MIKLESFSVKGTKGIIPKVNKILSKALIKPAEILNPFLFRFFFFFDFTLLGFFGRILAKLFNN